MPTFGFREPEINELCAFWPRVAEVGLGVAVGYPEIVGVATLIEFETGQALEVVVLTMAFYLTLALATATLLNWYNARIQLVGGN